jgi:phage terminase Nu1 subunit (DNA packaging protein)
MAKAQAKKKKKGRVAKKSARKKTAPAPADIDVQSGWLNKKQMAASLGITPQGFDLYGIDPVARRHKYGEAFYTCEQVVAFKVRKAVQAERERLERELSKRPTVDAAEILQAQAEADLELTQERAETQRLKNAQLRRELAPVDGIRWVLGQVAAKIGAVLDPLPGKIRRRVPSLTNADVEAIRHECVKAQNIASEIEVDWNGLDAVEPNSD